jgi:hypothetical protein
MAAQLPNFNTNIIPLSMLQDRWSAILNPVISNPVSSSSILTDIKLVAGTNTVNHLLSRKLQGWTIVRIDAPATIYDSQATNGNPNQTLLLVSSAAATVSILVF